MDKLEPSQTHLVERIGLIGTGMIGTSLLLSLKARNNQLITIGFDANKECLAEAHKIIEFEVCAQSPEQVFNDSDIVVIATPPSAISDVLSQVKNLREDMLITDVASNKRSVSQIAKSVLGDNCCQFVPGHPIAGSEFNGPQASSDQLFNLCRVVLTPLEQNSRQAIQTIADLWYHAGAQSVFQMADKEHDHIFAHTSHLPHILAYALVHSLGNNLSSEVICENSAGGLRDFSRIAASSPELWCDILMSNEDQIRDAVESFNVSLERLCAMLRECDRGALQKFLQQATTIQAQIKKN